MVRQLHAFQAQLPSHDRPFQLCLTPHLPFQMYLLLCRLVHYTLQQDTYFQVRCFLFSVSEWAAVKSLVKKVHVALNQIIYSNFVSINAQKATLILVISEN